MEGVPAGVQGRRQVVGAASLPRPTVDPAREPHRLVRMEPEGDCHVEPRVKRSTVQRWSRAVESGRRGSGRGASHSARFPSVHLPAVTIRLLASVATAFATASYKTLL